MQKRALLPIFTILALASCAQKINFGVPSGLGLNAKQDIDTPVISTLLVIDNSDSMRDEQEALAAGFRNVFDTLHNAEIVPNVDFYLYTTSSLTDFCARHGNDSTSAEAQAYCHNKSGDTLAKNAAMTKNTTFSWIDPLNGAMSGANFVQGLDYSAHSGFGLEDPATLDHSIVSIRSNMSSEDFEAQRLRFYNSILAVGTDGDLDESGLCTVGRFMLEKESKFNIAKGTPLATVIVSDDDEVTNTDPTLLSKCVHDTQRVDYKYTPDANSGSTYYKYTAGFTKHNLSMTWHQSKDPTAKIISVGTQTHFTMNYAYVAKDINVSYQDYADRWQVTYYPDKCAGDNQTRPCTSADAKTVDVPYDTAYGASDKQSFNASQACTGTTKSWLESSQANFKPIFGVTPHVSSCTVAYTQSDIKNRGTTATTSDEKARSNADCDSSTISTVSTTAATTKGRHYLAASCKMNRGIANGSKDIYNGDFSTYGISGKTSGSTGNCPSAMRTQISTNIGAGYVLLSSTQTVGTATYTPCTYTVKDNGDTYSGSYTFADLGISSSSDAFNASKLVAQGAKNFASTWCSGHTCKFGSFNTNDSVMTANNPDGVAIPSGTTSGTCSGAVLNYAKTQSGTGYVDGSCTFSVNDNVKSCNYTDSVANAGTNLCSNGTSLRASCGVDATYEITTACDRTQMTNGVSGHYVQSGTDGTTELVHKALSASANTLSEGIQAKIKADYGSRQFFMGAIVNNDKDYATGCLNGGGLAGKSRGYIDFANTQGNLGYVQSICNGDYSPTMSKLTDFIIKRIVPSYTFKAKTEDKIQSVQLVRNGTPITITEGTDYVLTKQVESASVVSYKITFLTKGEDDASVLQKGDSVSVKFLANY